MRLRPIPVAVAVCLAAMPLPILAQGAPPRTVPANPFASNYPSAPPPAAGHERRAVRARGVRAEPVPLPPARIPR